MDQKTLKVVFVLPALTAGGAERVLITLMNTLDRTRFSPEFITVTNNGPLKTLIDPDIPFHSLNSRWLHGSLPGLAFKLKKIKPDIVVSTMAHMNFTLLLLKPFFPKTRFIIREAVTPSFFLQGRSHLSFAIKTAYCLLYPWADLVLSPAQEIINEFSTVLHMTCKNYALLRNPVDLSRVRADETKHFEITEEREKTLHFIAAGRLHYQKGFDRLIEVLPQLNVPYDWKLTILGEGSERQALESLIREKGLTDKVSLPGLSHNPWPHYAAADCFLMPSRWEGLPNVVLESLACGTSVIATRDSGGIKEIANLASKGTVTVVDDMPAFLKAMEVIKPHPSKTFRPSLLPKDFDKESITVQFSNILDSVFSAGQREKGKHRNE